MFIHWSKDIHIERVGKRVVRVECTNCGCEYFFNLIRIGTGRASAPYSIGVGRATRDAEKKAEADLESRLKLEQELVPCPKCHWVNEELIQGYRQGRYRGLGKAAIVFAVFGFCTLLPLCWLLYDDLVTAKLLWPFFVGATVCFWLIGLGMLGLRNFLRNRIQPNRTFPDPPKLPPGIPTAFIVDSDSGELVPATSERPPVELTNGWLDFRMGNDYLPMQCCGCLEAPDPGCGHASQLSATLQLEIPRCAGCSKLARANYWRVYLIAFLGGLLVTGAIAAVTVSIPSHDAWIVLLGGFVVDLGLAAYIAGVANVPVKVRGLDLARGTVRLRFCNPQYGEVVAKHLSGL
ncbi:hypothetical protein BH10PLA2_BH10PLA2_03650 [soil metagenome]